MADLVVGGLGKSLVSLVEGQAEGALGIGLSARGRRFSVKIEKVDKMCISEGKTLVCRGI